MNKKSDINHVYYLNAITSIFKRIYHPISKNKFKVNYINNVYNNYYEKNNNMLNILYKDFLYHSIYSKKLFLIVRINNSISGYESVLTICSINEFNELNYFNMPTSDYSVVLTELLKFLNVDKCYINHYINYKVQEMIDILTMIPIISNQYIYKNYEFKLKCMSDVEGYDVYELNPDIIYTTGNQALLKVKAINDI